MNDANRSVATLAVSTLLKTVEVSRYSLFFSKSSIRIDSLLTRISSYMNEIDDEFKQILVKSLFTLTVQYPDKYDVILTFLSTILRSV